MDSPSLPDYIKRYFWGDNLSDLDLKKNQTYIIQVILEYGGSQALHWLFSTYSKETIKEALPTLRLSKKSSIFWHVYLS